jgi:cyclophilin family peptidyl-prolyl cis-trans isomerase
MVLFDSGKNTMKHRISTICLGLIVMIAVGGSPLAWGQAAGENPAPTPAEAKAKFDQSFADYKAALRKIEELRTAFQTADAAARVKINEQLSGEIAAAQKRVDAMVAAAIVAYRAAPNSDPVVTNLLIAVAKHHAVGEGGADHDGANGGSHANAAPFNGGDQYEAALPIIKLLIDNGAKEKQLPIWGFVSAFAANDYDLAATYWKQADESGALADRGSVTDPAAKDVIGYAMQYAQQLDKYRDLWAAEQAIRATEAKADDLPRVKLSTTKGDIVIELFENQAPQSVANFITLAKSGFYNGLAFHRVLHAFMAQGGDPKGDGTGGPGYTIRDECNDPNYRHHFRGTLSMAHTAAPNSGGSQFFLTFVPTGHLDAKHTAFGRVIEGMDVLGELQKREPNGDPQHDAQLPEPDKIIKAEVLRDRGHEYKFEKLSGG